MDGVSAIVNEADGAAGRPLKAPREGEPVIPDNTTLLVPVMGIDGMGRPLDEETVFRSAIASRLLNLPIGSTVTEEVIARLMRELIKSGPAGARVVPLINKVDIPGGREKAERLARHLLSLDPPRIRRVVLGQLRAHARREGGRIGLTSKIPDIRAFPFLGKTTPAPSPP